MRPVKSGTSMMRSTMSVDMNTDPSALYISVCTLFTEMTFLARVRSTGRQCWP